jgi:hypothetical protein
VKSLKSRNFATFAPGEDQKAGFDRVWEPGLGVLVSIYGRKDGGKEDFWDLPELGGAPDGAPLSPFGLLQTLPDSLDLLSCFRAVLLSCLACPYPCRVLRDDDIGLIHHRLVRFGVESFHGSQNGQHLEEALANGRDERLNEAASGRQT